MSCPLCAHNVDKQLSQIPGVTGVALDMGSGKVKLALDGSGRATRSAVKKAIDESGFTLVEVTTP
jgi:copper chaperone CopZ